MTDAATASRSLLLDLDHVEWTTEAAGSSGWRERATRRSLTTHRSSARRTASVARCRSPACASTSRPRSSPSRAASAGEAKCTYGTGAFLLATTGADPVRSSHGLVGCVAWRLAGRAHLVPRRAGLHGRRRGLLAARASASSTARPTSIALGGSVADAAGVTFVPGAGRPGVPRSGRPQARGALTGLSLGTERAHLVRAAIEGIAAQVAWLARAAAADLGQAARAPPRRRRSDALAHPAAGAGRPPAGAGRGLPVAARHRARRRRVRPARPVRSVGRSARRPRARGRGARLAGRPRSSSRRSAPTRPRSASSRGGLRRRPHCACERVGRDWSADVRRRRRRRGRGRCRRRPAAVPPPAAGRADRGRRRRRRRDEQGQHGHPPHRLRRHARHASRRAWSRAATRCCATTRQRSASRWSRSGAVLVAWDDEQAERLPSLTAKAAANGYTAHGDR